MNSKPNNGCLGTLPDESAYIREPSRGENTTSVIPREWTHRQWPAKMKVKVKSLNHVRLFGTPWTEACQAPLSMEFSSKNTGMGCHFLLQEIFPTQGSHSHLLCLLHWKVNSLLLPHLGCPLYKGPWYKCALSSFLPWRTVTFFFKPGSGVWFVGCLRDKMHCFVPFKC